MAPLFGNQTQILKAYKDPCHAYAPHTALQISASPKVARPITLIGQQMRPAGPLRQHRLRRPRHPRPGHSDWPCRNQTPGSPKADRLEALCLLAGSKPLIQAAASRQSGSFVPRVQVFMVPRCESSSTEPGITSTGRRTRRDGNRQLCESGLVVAEIGPLSSHLGA